MSWQAVRAGAQADDPPARSDGASGSDLRILDDRAAFDRHAELRRSVEIEVRRRLAALDMLGAAVEVVAESFAEAEVVEMGRDPPHRARRSNRRGQVRR